MRHLAYDIAVQHRGTVHELENLRNLLAPLSIHGQLLPRAKGRLRTAASSRDPKRCDIVFHPWASGFRYTMREWPSERWAELAHHLIDAGATIWITGGPSDQPKAQNLEAMINRPGRTFVIGGFGRPVRDRAPDRGCSTRRMCQYWHYAPRGSARAKDGSASRAYEPRTMGPIERQRYRCRSWQVPRWCISQFRL